MKIGLMGCEFVSPNKGCEALSYSIVSVLNNIIDEELTIYNFSGTELGSIEKEFSNIKFENVDTKLKTLSLNYYKKLQCCDFILDATMGDSFSDIYSKKYFNKLALHKRIAEFFNKNYILLPQTYGPFNEKSSAKSAKKIFNKAKKIFCRDELSQNILKNDFGITNSELVTDMAFLLPYHKDKYQFKSKTTKIGINISGLLYKGGFSSKNQFDLTIDYKKLIDELLSYLTKKKQYEVHLIPHVIDLTDNAYDDDYNACKKLNKKHPKTVLAPAFNNPIDAKSYISNMDLFIGSRMHSTIAAFSSRVPCIPVSYSRKFEGLFNSIDYPYVISAKVDDTKTAFEKILRYTNSRDKLKNDLLKSEKLVNKKTQQFVNSVREILNNK